MMNFLFFAYILLWTAAIAKDALFWTYLWQLKEHRLDRMRAHFELPSSRSFVINYKTALLAVFIFLALIALLVSFMRPLILIALIVFYGLQAHRIILAIQERALTLPVFTPKAGIMTAFTAATYAIIFLIAIKTEVAQAILILLISHILMPLIVSFAVGLLKPISRMLKQRIVHRAKEKRAALPELLVIGITGSYGKTSVKEFLAHILAEKFLVQKTPANINTEMGVAQFVLRELKAETEIFIVEMGAYKKGEIRAICSIVQPSIGILTGLNQQHISLFGSMRNIQEAKFELIESLPPKGLAVFNGDNTYGRTLSRICKNPKRLYSTQIPADSQANGDIYVRIANQRPNGMRIEIQEKNERKIMDTPLVGRHNALNAAGAICIARALGMNFEEISQRIQTLKQPPHSLEIKKGIKHVTIIDDSYSANPDGTIAALDMLKNFGGRQKICIMRPLIELGPNASAIHKRIGSKIGESCNYCIMTNEDFFPIIKKEAMDAGLKANSIWCIPDGYTAMRKAQELCDEGDIILLENRMPESVLKGLIIEEKE